MSEEKVLEVLLRFLCAERDRCAGMVEAINDIIKEYKLEVAGIPKLDITDIDALPWKTYKAKEPAKPGEAAWLLANTQGAEELAKTIKSSPREKLEFGEYLYQFSGKEKQFISRRPKPKPSNPHGSRRP